MKDLFIHKEMKTKIVDFKNTEIALVFSAVYLKDKNKRSFTSNNAKKEFDIYQNEHTEYRISIGKRKLRDFNKDIADNVENNSNNAGSKNGKGYFRLLGKKGSSHIYSMTDRGIDKANDIMKQHFNVENYFSKKMTSTTIGKIKTNTSGFTISEIHEKFVNGEFIIPRYQRSYVWTEKQAQDLQYSISKNFPIGSFLIWERNINSINKDSEKDSSKVVNHVIDGQQRTQTMLYIYETPMKFVSESIFDNFIGNGTRFVYHLVSDFLNKFKSLSLEDIEKFDTSVETDDLNLEDRIELKDLIVKYCKNITTMNNAKYPTIVIKNADEEQIIEIFTFLNTKGTGLTPFEILSAKWSKNEIKLDNKLEWSGQINLLYKDSVVSSKETREKIFTPSEIYYFILWRSLANKGGVFNTVFGKELPGSIYKLDKSNLMRLLWLIRVWYVHDLGLELDEVPYGEDFDVELGEFIAKKSRNENFWEIEKFIETLKGVWKDIGFNLPVLKTIEGLSGVLKSLGSNLFVSMAAQVLHKRLKDEKYKIPPKLQYYFINSILENEFSHNTSKHLHDDVVNLSYLKDDLELVEIIDKIKILNEKQSKISELLEGFDNTSKFIVSIIYSKINNQLKPENYDFDHIFARNAMKKLNIDVGVHAIGNCGQLSKHLNQQKQDKMNAEELLKDELMLRHIHSFTDPLVKELYIDDYQNYIKNIQDLSIELNERKKQFEFISDYRFDIQMKILKASISIEMDQAKELKNAMDLVGGDIFVTSQDEEKEISEKQL